MDAEKLAHYRSILTAQLHQQTEQVRDSQAAALEMAATDDGVKDTVDMSVMDVNQEIELRLGERQSQLVADIDQALLRMDEGSYGICGRCGQAIPEARLDALPTARHDAACQTMIEAEQDTDDPPTL